MILSLGSGSGVNEICCDIPCLCIDKERQCIFSACVNMKGVWKSKKNQVYHAVYDFSVGTGLYDICSILTKQFPNLSISILYQHPSPSKEKLSRLAYSKSGFLSIHALVDNLVSDIHFVYDVKEGKTCWNKHDIISTFSKMIDLFTRKKLLFSEELLISKIGESEVDHPKYGCTARMGWAYTRKGDEKTFYIEKVN